MKKPIEKIKPNPFRNFEIYPLGQLQIDKLKGSVKDLGMWAGLPARKVGEGYEIACGHHRLEALIQLGIDVVDIAVRNYSDDDMIKIMVTENMTQRGHENFGAVLDSVGAVVTRIVSEVYRENKDAEFCAIFSIHKILANLKNVEGIGRDLIHRYEPSIPREAAETAVRTLKACNQYADLIDRGGAPAEVVNLYVNKNPITAVNAVSLFSKPTQAKNWLNLVDNDLVRASLPRHNHKALIEELTFGNGNVSAKVIEKFIKKQLGGNIQNETTFEDKLSSLNNTVQNTTGKINSILELTKEEVNVSEIFLDEDGLDDSVFALQDAINVLIEKFDKIENLKRS